MWEDESNNIAKKYSKIAGVMIFTIGDDDDSHIYGSIK